MPVFEAHALTNILFSSGTTGTPKAIGWTHLTPIEPLQMAGDTTTSVRAMLSVADQSGMDDGALADHASLLNGATIALTGNPLRPVLSLVEEARVTMLGVVPSLVRAWKAAMPPREWTGPRFVPSLPRARRPILKKCTG